LRDCVKFQPKIYRRFCTITFYVFYCWVIFSRILYKLRPASSLTVCVVNSCWRRQLWARRLLVQRAPIFSKHIHQYQSQKSLNWIGQSYRYNARISLYSVTRSIFLPAIDDVIDSRTKLEMYRATLIRM